MPNTDGLTVMSLNVGRMLEPRTRQFLQELVASEAASDVICIQDIPAHELGWLLERWPHIAFAPMTNNLVSGIRKIVGIAVLSRYQMTHIEHCTCWGDGVVKDMEGVDDHNERYLGDQSDRMIEATEDRVLIMATVEKDGVSYNLATTHGMWTRGGVTNDVQRTSTRRLRKALYEHSLKQGGIVLAADVNAGRGTEMYRYLVEHLRDEVPEDVETTLDPDHGAVKKYGIKVVTDFFMQAPDRTGGYAYTVDDFRARSGVSDHQAISATIKLAV